MQNRLQIAIDAAAQQHHAGVDMPTIISATRTALANAGEFGKNLDRSVRRVIRQATGVTLEPGAGHGSRSADGGINYRG